MGSAATLTGRQAETPVVGHGREPGSDPEPWRGTKPMEGEGAWSPATVGRATDPTAEQGPEVEGRHREPSFCAGKGWRHNGKRATVLVTGCGCWRGGFFEGCEPCCGNGRGSAHETGHTTLRRVLAARGGGTRGWSTHRGTRPEEVPAREQPPSSEGGASQLKRSRPCSAAGCNKPATGDPRPGTHRPARWAAGNQATASAGGTYRDQAFETHAIRRGDSGRRCSAGVWSKPSRP